MTQINNFAQFYEIYGPDMMTLQEYVNRIVRRVSWKALERQEELIYMSGNKGKYPELKEGAWVTLNEIIIEEMGWLRCDIISGIIDSYYRGIINPGPYRGMLEETYGWDYPDWPEDTPFEEYTGEGPVSSRPAFKPFEDEG